MPTSELLGTAEVAQLLSKDVRTVHRMIRRGEIPAQKLPGRTAAYIIRRTDVEAMLSTAGERAS
ncbi:MAG: helix-turn-helix domain-containing protein [Actinomycetales bacterium]|nr:helix-turn-helix domain-containing protein [Actinomycetales bacterium]MBK5250888.1 helix-turn-helix domain-containing protein [Actinomycetales bacterium]HZL03964.1 helix-turn-helix domain-containing protein [Coriobacteriia bacterium]